MTYPPSAKEVTLPDRDFDPSYGYSKNQLLQVPTPQEPPGFLKHWQKRYSRVTAHTPQLKLSDSGRVENGFRILNAQFTSSHDFEIKGWVLKPEFKTVQRGLIMGHGYGGVDGPYTNLPFADAVIFQPCFRGLGLSTHPNISSQPQWHVLHNIQNYREYILGYCVEDLWLATSAFIHSFPEVEHHLGYMGISFSGGIGALALACEHRIQKAHFNVPTFGNYQLRLQLPTLGSGHSVQCFHRRNPTLTENTLSFHDAAIAAKHIHVPMHFACAKSDPMVAPPGQFAIYNAVTAPKELFWLKCGHMDYPEQEQENQQLTHELTHFFSTL